MCKTAVLFWCYKDPEVCRDRLLWLRKYNPQVSVYVLFGGDGEKAADFRQSLAGLHDDFWTHHGRSPEGLLPDAIHCPDGGQNWKWYYGDLMLRDWYQDRGRQLIWDRVFVMQ